MTLTANGSNAKPLKVENWKRNFQESHSLLISSSLYPTARYLCHHPICFCCCCCVCFIYDVAVTIDSFSFIIISHFPHSHQVWCSKMRRQALERLIKTDSHSPGSVRTIGPPSLLPQFREAFKCKSGSPMASEESCSIW